MKQFLRLNISQIELLLLQFCSARKDYCVEISRKYSKRDQRGTHLIKKEEEFEIRVGVSWFWQCERYFAVILFSNICHKEMKM